MLTRDQAVQRAEELVPVVSIVPAEMARLYELAAMAPEGPAVEVGLYEGRSLLAWAPARAGRGQVYGVDIQPTALLRENVARSGYPIEILEGLSWEAWRQVPDGLGFVFIDADHTIDGFPKDLLPWAVKVKRGGILAVHDYGAGKGHWVVTPYTNWWQHFARWEDLGVTVYVQAYRRPG
jgi:predicted O-methyltransferase YrrM